MLLCISVYKCKLYSFFVHFTVSWCYSVIFTVYLLTVFTMLWCTILYSFTMSCKLCTTLNVMVFFLILIGISAYWCKLYCICVHCSVLLCTNVTHTVFWYVSLWFVTAVSRTVVLYTALLLLLYTILYSCSMSCKLCTTLKVMVFF